MDRVWDKIDGYTKSDNLDSSDDEDADCSRKKATSPNAENSLTIEGDNESSSDDVDLKNDDNLHESVLNEMRRSQLHCNTEQRNTQEKVDNFSSEKKQQKGELSEMHHKAQVISKSARMSPGDVLSTITNSETMDIEENSQMEEYYDKIRSVQTESDSTEIDPEKESGKASSSNINLPEISPAPTVVLNTGLMKSKANIARQGSMGARRKPTAMKRKSLTGIIELNLNEQDETTAMYVDGTEESATSQKMLENESEEPVQRTDSCTPTDSSSEDEKEVSKPHMHSAIALPGLGDAMKIQLQRSELKRPTALHLVMTAKDAKENEVTKEVKTDVAPSKPDWMKEVELRKNAPRAARRKHVTLPGRCTELDDLFEKRRNLKPMEVRATEAEATSQDQETIARESSKPKLVPAGDSLDPQLSKLFEKRRNLAPMEGMDKERGNQEIMNTPTFSRPRSLHLEDREVTELDKCFERRRNLKPVEGVRTQEGQGRMNESVGPGVRLGNRDQEVSGIFRARIHDGHTKLEPLPVSNSGHVKVANISEVKPKTTRQEDITSFSPTPPPSGQRRSGQIDQVGQKAGNHKVTPVTTRYVDSQSRGLTGHTSHTTSQERFPQSSLSPTGSGTAHVGHPHSNQSGEHQMQPLSPTDTRSPNYHRSPSSSNHDDSRGRFRSKHREPLRDNNREFYSKTTVDKNSDRGNTYAKSYHGNLPSISHVENSASVPSSHLPKRHELSHNQHPLNINPTPQSYLQPLLSNTPAARYPVRNHEHKQNGSSNYNRTHEDDYILSPPPDKLRKSTARAEPSGRNRNSLVNSEDRRNLSNRGFKNERDRVRSPEFYSSAGSDVDMGNQVKPVTVTVKSISENPVRAQIKENGNSSAGARNHVLSRVQGGGEGPRRNDGMGGSDPRHLESPVLAPVVPKWKQELQEKKRLQQGRQKEMPDTNKKVNQPEKSGNDLAEWQKRLKGIRKSWSEIEGPGNNNNNNDNVKELESKSDQENEVPGFLKEFKAKKMKQKVKVTVTAKSTPSHQDTRVNVDEDPELSSNQELGTYV